MSLDTRVDALHIWDELWFHQNVLSRVPDSVSVSSVIDGKEARDVRDESVPSHVLQRAPSLPPLCMEPEDEGVREKMISPKLLHCVSSLDDRRHRSYCSKSTARSTPASERHRPPRTTKLEGTKSDFMIRQMSFSKAFEEKKWKSLSDLEYLQRSTRMLTTCVDIQRSAPPMVKWAGRRSAEDMKEQLRFWAKNVACNVRQEC